MCRTKFGMLLFFASCCIAPYLLAQPWPVVSPTRRIFEVPEVDKANITFFIESPQHNPLYKFQCHSAGYSGDPDFDYSGDVECRLSSVGRKDSYSTLLTEDPQQSRDWESRGRFFASELRGVCAQVPQFGAVRHFRLRGMDLTLEISQPKFKNDKLVSLTLTVTVLPDEKAKGAIAAAVPLPKTGVPDGCSLQEHFVEPPTN